MAVAFRSASAISISTGGANPHVVTYASGVASGDLLVIHYVTTTGTVTTPSGWTQLYSVIPGNDFSSHYVFYRIAGGSEPSTVNITKSSGNAAASVMTAYTGADTTTPINTYATANLPTSGTSGTTPSVTTTVANTLLIRLLTNWGGPATVTPAGSVTERYDVVWSFNSEQLELGTETQAAIGASGTSAVTFSTAISGGLSTTIAVAPVAAAVAPKSGFLAFV